MRAPTHSSPAVSAGLVFTLAEPVMAIAQLPRLHCLDAGSGERKWTADMDYFAAMPAEKEAAGHALWEKHCRLFKQSREWMSRVLAIEENLLADDAMSVEQKKGRVLRRDVAYAFDMAFRSLGNAKTLPGDPKHSAR
jgi:hypothetical protein